MVKNYPYLKDTNFLNKIYGLHNKTNYVSITVLDWTEKRLQDIQGRVISASVSVNGDSTVRRTANLSIKINNESELYSNIDSIFSINKKIFLEIGIKNIFGHLGERYYPNYPVIWFPFGTYIIQSFSLTHDINGVILNLSIGDKMCLLNGEAGGTIPASTNFESYDTVGPDGDLHSESIRINAIIPELVNHFGGEDLNKIFVNDIPNKIKQVLKWKGTSPLYLLINKQDQRDVRYTPIEPQPNWSNDYQIVSIPYNYDAGYTYVDFVYPGELTAGAGDSVCTILDKIKTTLGNFEYYYDVFGNFIFQEIKNYVNTTQWRTVYQTITDPGVYLPYAYNTTLNSAVYDFTNSDFIINYNNNPQLSMIKNDFIVWGERENSNGQKMPCRYHLVIDKRPYLENDLTINGVVFDTSMYDKTRRAFIVTGNRFSSLQELKDTYPQGLVGHYYYVNNLTDTSETGVYSWITDINRYKTMMENYKTSGQTTALNPSEEATDESNDVVAGYLKMDLATFYSVFTVDKDTDWRNILYFSDLQAAATGSQTSYYWAEMCNEWPKIYDIENDEWKMDVINLPTSLDWWLDLIDNDATLNNFGVDIIGRRSYATVDSKCNCVFEPDIPDVVMVDVADVEGIVDTRSQYTQLELKELGLIPTQVGEHIYNALLTGGTFNSCYQHVRQLITNYTDYNENISFTCLPIYHLEPNTCIKLNDPDSGISGNYLINSLSYDLGNSNTMTISAKKIIEKI